jgi:hypothetical protein
MAAHEVLLTLRSLGKVEKKKAAATASATHPPQQLRASRPKNRALIFWRAGSRRSAKAPIINLAVGKLHPPCHAHKSTTCLPASCANPKHDTTRQSLESSSLHPPWPTTPTAVRCPPRDANPPPPRPPPLTCQPLHMARRPAPLAHFLAPTACRLLPVLVGSLPLASLGTPAPRRRPHHPHTGEFR